MSNTVTLYTSNILETATVTVTGTPDAGYLESRLHDRYQSHFWKVSGTQQTIIHVNQDSESLPVDFLAIGSHNFNGEDIDWQWSTNDADWTNAVDQWSQSDNYQAVKTLGSSLTKQYWRVVVSSMLNPRCTEVYMSLGYDFDVRVDPLPMPERSHVDNVEWRRTVGGLERSQKWGDARRYRKYCLVLNASDLVNFRAAMADLDEYSKPFFIKDDEDAYFMVRLLEVPVERPLTGTNNEKTVTLQMVEI